MYTKLNNVCTESVQNYIPLFRMGVYEFNKELL